MENESTVDHPSHYGGENNIYEVINVLEEWDFGFHVSNAIKYIARAGKKKGVPSGEDLRKAQWYLNRLVEKNLLEELHRKGFKVPKKEYTSPYVKNITESWKLDYDLTEAISKLRLGVLWNDLSLVRYASNVLTHSVLYKETQ